MKRTLIKALATALCLCLSLCALAEGAAPAGVLAVVDGVEIPIGSAQAEFEYYAQQREAYAQAYGIPFDPEALKADIAAYYVKVYLIRREAEALGLVDTSDEALAALAAEAEAQYEAAVAEYMEYFRDDTMTDEQARAVVIEWMDAQGFTLDYLTQSLREERAIDAYEAHITGQVTVTDEDVQARYQEQVDAAKATYDAVPAQFENDVLQGAVIYYIPEGYRSVFHILLLLDSDGQAQLRTLETRLKTAQESLKAEGADEAALNAEIDDAQRQIDELLAPLYQRMDEVQGRLDAGEDFLALMDELGEDPGMQREPNRTTGYYVSQDSTNWVTEFRDAAMALEKPGDVSAPVRTSYGLHLIYYAGDLAAGPVAYESVSDQLTNDLTDERTGQAVNDAIQALYDTADVTLYTENLVYTAPEAEPTEAEAETEADDTETEADDTEAAEADDAEAAEAVG